MDSHDPNHTATRRIGDLFISLHHADAKVAEALSQAIRDVFGDRLTTNYSTSKELEGGIQHGEEWFRWIVTQVRQSEVAVILVTPASSQKPWILWEAGAVFGAGVDPTKGNNRKVRPLLFKLARDQVPSPFGVIQGVAGDDRAGITKFFNDLIGYFIANGKLEGREIQRASQAVDPAVDRYLPEVELALRGAPLLPTEPLVQEWCQRIDRLSDENRRSEVGQLHDWLNLTFGRTSEGKPQPIDLRLHRRLGEAYRAAKRPDRAAEQFELAVGYAPRDIFLLRALGLAYLDSNRRDAAKKIIDQIAELDPRAYSRDVECAAFKTRFQRDGEDWNGAAETCRVAWENNADSYYLGDVLGQCLLQLAKVDEARDVYRRVAAILDRLSETNIWTRATSATAALVLGDQLKLISALGQISRLDPAPDDLKRIEDGLERVAKALGQPDDTQRWRDVLRGRT
ncbi:MAG TPA: TIR domain-containing protein [Planctomycetaceae bacterium]|jgi:tetratricopeptide (TPR) repeat protein|nr:TIR domain-containing protein [Planctomycetaceae bacterium]